MRLSRDNAARQVPEHVTASARRPARLAWQIGQPAAVHAGSSPTGPMKKPKQVHVLRAIDWLDGREGDVRFTELVDASVSSRRNGI